MRFDTILILPYIIIVLLFDVTAVGMVQEVAGFPLNYKAGGSNIAHLVRTRAKYNKK